MDGGHLMLLQYFPFNRLNGFNVKRQLFINSHLTLPITITNKPRAPLKVIYIYEQL